MWEVSLHIKHISFLEAQCQRLIRGADRLSAGLQAEFHNKDYCRLQLISLIRMTAASALCRILVFDVGMWLWAAHQLIPR
jgi:hypothetical protein